MEYKFEKGISNKGSKFINLGVSTYKNDLDYCIIDDFIKSEGEVSSKTTYKGRIYLSWRFAIKTDTLQRLLDAIYAIQRVPSSDTEALGDMVWAKLPCAITYKRDIESKEFLKELWYTGEFIEKLLKSGANYFILNEWVKE